MFGKNTSTSGSTVTPTSWNVVIYHSDGRVDRYDRVSDKRATQLEQTFGSSPTIMRITCTPVN